MATPRPAKKKGGRSSLDNAEAQRPAIVQKPITPLPPSARKAHSPFSASATMQQPTPLPFHKRGGGPIFCADASLCSFFSVKGNLRTSGMHQMSCRHLPPFPRSPSPQGPRALAGILPKEKGEQKSNADVPNQKPLWAIPLHAQPSRTYHRPLSRW